MWRRMRRGVRARFGSRRHQGLFVQPLLSDARLLADPGASIFHDRRDAERRRESRNRSRRAMIQLIVASAEVRFHDFVRDTNVEVISSYEDMGPNLAPRILHDL